MLVLVQMMVGAVQAKRHCRNQWWTFIDAYTCAPPGLNELTLYSHPVLPWYQHHWKVHDMFEFFFYYAWIISLPIYHNNLFSHWRQGIIITVFLLLKLKTGDGRLGAFVVAGDTVGCHGDKLRCHRWRLGSLSLRSSVFFGFQCSINMTLAPDLPW